MLKTLGQFIFFLIYKEEIIEAINKGMQILKDSIILPFER